MIWGSGCLTTRKRFYLDDVSMKVTVELSDSELKDICRFTGEKKKGPAIRKMAANALKMKRPRGDRREIHLPRVRGGVRRL
jgi:hypothetical protein